MNNNIKMMEIRVNEIAQKKFEYWKEKFIKELIEKIEGLITKEKDCMKRDKYPEQELEHLNQIEMANKIKQIIKKEFGRRLIK